MSNDKGFFASLADYLTGLVNEHHELAAWLVLAGLAGAVYAGKAPIDWPVVTLAFLSLFTLLGSRRFRGLSFGPDGVEVAGKTTSNVTTVTAPDDEAAKKVAKKVRSQLEGPLKSFADHLQKTETIVPLELIDLTAVDGIGPKTAVALERKLADQGTTTVSGLLDRDSLPIVEDEVGGRLRSYLEGKRSDTDTEETT